MNKRRIRATQLNDIQRLAVALLTILAASPAVGEERLLDLGAVLDREFVETVQPFLKVHCLNCHGPAKQEAKLDLSGFTTAVRVAKELQVWEHVLQRVEAGEMPPEEAKRKPSDQQRSTIVQWIRAVRNREADRLAGDPGPVLARRLSNAEYNLTIRDLIGHDIRPTREFPVDPANEAGFDNSAESLAMSAGLVGKYLNAAREVTDHLVLKPDGFDFAPHPVVTDTDRDKYCVNRIIAFYNAQPTDLAKYFFAAWQFQHREALGHPNSSLADFAKKNLVSPKYLATVWQALTSSINQVGPLAKLRNQFASLPGVNHLESLPDDTRVLSQCRELAEFVVNLRQKLEPKVADLSVPDVSKGSQALILWKNRQYAANRWRCDLAALRTEGDDPDLIVPDESGERAKHEAAFVEFCSVFPDVFYVSERGRDYVGKPKAEQEKGRLLSAGFHSMMGYFRDDGPLYDMILDADQQQQLDRLWQELDFIAGAPIRQYTGYIWFERAETRFLHDEVFDFARSEDKDSTSQAKIQKLADVYLAKVRRLGGDGEGLRAIEDFYRNMNNSIRWVEQARLQAQESHLKALLEFTRRAFRRPLTDSDREDVLSFYRQSRERDSLGHEEAVQDTLVYILMSPQFLFRMDLAAEGPVRPLTDFELANRLSYFLWSSMPDDELLASAAEGRLSEPSELIRQSRRLLKSPKVRGMVTEFAGNWLDFRRFEEHNSVDRQRFPNFTNDLRRSMFEEPLFFFEDLIHFDRSILELLYSSRTIVNEDLAKHYGIDSTRAAVPEVARVLAQESDAALTVSSVGSARPGETWRAVDDVRTLGRGGLLGMSVFLTQNSPGLRTSPVKRGYWVARRLLGERIPAPPPNVPELPADETKLGEQTLPQMLATHRQNKSCASCHDRFDALGVALEGFGPIGEKRTVDLGGRAVQESAEFPDASIRNGVEGLRNYIREHRQQDFLDNVGGKLLSYALCRNLLPSDDRLLSSMQVKLRHDEFRFSSMVEAIVTSPQFLTKRGTQQE